MDEPSFERDARVKEHLESLRKLPPREPQAAERGRAAFLAQAQDLAQSVSKQQKRRLGYWSIFSNKPFQRKERFSMFTTLVSIITVLVIALGGTGATVYAAQGSLPGDSLYQLKIQSEDLRLQWENNAMSKIELALQFANRRVEEIQAMLKKGQPFPESVPLRLQNQLDTAFRLASGLDEDNLGSALTMIRQTLEQQERIMVQLQEGANENPILLRVRDQLRTRLSWVEEGQTDPVTFRARFGPFGKDMTPPAATNTPGEGFGPGPFVTGTPTPAGGYGPGPGPQATCTCTPQSGQGPQPTPGPGKGTGPGPQPSSTCTPQAGPGSQPMPGDGNGPGMQPTEPGHDTSPGPQPTSPESGNNPGSGNKP